MLCLADPQDVITPRVSLATFTLSARIQIECLPDQNLSQCARTLAVDEFLGVRELDVHVKVHGDEAALIFGISPFQPYDDILVNPMYISAYSLWLGLLGCASRTYKLCNRGRGLKGATVWFPG
jgi:hypothetical protein